MTESAIQSQQCNPQLASSLAAIDGCDVAAAAGEARPRSESFIQEKFGRNCEGEIRKLQDRVGLLELKANEMIRRASEDSETQKREEGFRKIARLVDEERNQRCSAIEALKQQVRKVNQDFDNQIESVSAADRDKTNEMLALNQDVRRVRADMEKSSHVAKESLDWEVKQRAKHSQELVLKLDSVITASDAKSKELLLLDQDARRMRAELDSCMHVLRDGLEAEGKIRSTKVEEIFLKVDALVLSNDARASEMLGLHTEVRKIRADTFSTQEATKAADSKELFCKVESLGAANESNTHEMQRLRAHVDQVLQATEMAKDVSDSDAQTHVTKAEDRFSQIEFLVGANQEQNISIHILEQAVVRLRADLANCKEAVAVAPIGDLKQSSLEVEELARKVELLGACEETRVTDLLGLKQEIADLSVGSLATSRSAAPAEEQQSANLDELLSKIDSVAKATLEELLSKINLVSEADRGKAEQISSLENRIVSLESCDHPHEKGATLSAERFDQQLEAMKRDINELSSQHAIDFTELLSKAENFLTVGSDQDKCSMAMFHDAKSVCEKIEISALVMKRAFDQERKQCDINYEELFGKTESLIAADYSKTARVEKVSADMMSLIQTTSASTNALEDEIRKYAVSSEHLRTQVKSLVMIDESRTKDIMALEEEIQSMRKLAATCTKIPAEAPENTQGGFVAGMCVIVQNLRASAELNGRRARVKNFDLTSGRYVVILEDGGGQKSLKSENMHREDTRRLVEEEAIAFPVPASLPNAQAPLVRSPERRCSAAARAVQMLQPSSGGKERDAEALLESDTREVYGNLDEELNRMHAVIEVSTTALENSSTHIGALWPSPLPVRRR